MDEPSIKRRRLEARAQSGGGDAREASPVSPAAGQPAACNKWQLREKWAAFNDWCKAEMKRTNLRPRKDTVTKWYETNAHLVWAEHDRPTLKEVRSHAKDYKPTDAARNYMRKYRAANKARKEQANGNSLPNPAAGHTMDAQHAMADVHAAAGMHSHAGIPFAAVEYESGLYAHAGAIGVGMPAALGAPYTDGSLPMAPSSPDDAQTMAVSARPKRRAAGPGEAYGCDAGGGADTSPLSHEGTLPLHGGGGSAFGRRRPGAEDVRRGTPSRPGGASQLEALADAAAALADGQQPACNGGVSDHGPPGEEAEDEHEQAGSGNGNGLGSLQQYGAKFVAELAGQKLRQLYGQPGGQPLLPVCNNMQAVHPSLHVRRVASAPMRSGAGPLPAPGAQPRPRQGTAVEHGLAASQPGTAPQMPLPFHRGLPPTLAAAAAAMACAGHAAAAAPPLRSVVSDGDAEAALQASYQAGMTLQEAARIVAQKTTSAANGTNDGPSPALVRAAMAVLGRACPNISAHARSVATTRAPMPAGSSSGGGAALAQAQVSLPVPLAAVANDSGTAPPADGLPAAGQQACVLPGAGAASAAEGSKDADDAVEAATAGCSNGAPGPPHDS